MATKFTKKGIRRLALLSVATAATIATTYATGAFAGQRNLHRSSHQIHYPAFNPTIASGCEDEADEYAASLVALAAAQGAADAAYYAWASCHSGHPASAEEQLEAAPETSILQR